MSEPLFDPLELPPTFSGWLYCESCTAAFQMIRKDALLCPCCGMAEPRALTHEEMRTLTQGLIGSTEFINVLTGGEDIPTEATEFAQSAMKALQSFFGSEGA